MSNPATLKGTKVSCTINGQKVTVESGTTILKAARSIGIQIPTLCYLEKLKPIGSCRICSVQVEGVDSMVMSCKTPVSEGLNVTTDNEKIAKYRQDMMRMILVDHPLDCVVCERSGECSLQNRTFDLNVTGHAWRTAEPRKAPMVDWGLIQYNQNLCIMCERCVKVCREVQGVAAYKIDGHGYGAKINTVSGEKLDCDFCGQCISVCPVGALSSGIYFTGRAWEMKKTHSICAHCGVGCTVVVNTKGGKVVRVTSNNYAGINSGNLCSRGRFGFEYISSGERLETPLVNDGKQFVLASWEDAVARIVEKIKVADPASVAAIGSERSTNEDNYALQKFVRKSVGSGFVEHVANMENGSLVSGIFDEFGALGSPVSFDEMKNGNLFVYVGADGSNESPVVGNIIRHAYIENGAEVVIAYSKDGSFLPEPRFQIRYDYPQLYGFAALLLSAATAESKERGGFAGGASPMADVLAEAEKSAAALKADDETLAAVKTLASLIREKGNTSFIVGAEALRHPQAVSIVKTIKELARLTGGKTLLLKEYSNSRGAADMGLSTGRLPGYAKVDGADGESLLEKMENGKIKVLLVMNEDVVSRFADSARMKAAVEKVEFVAVIDQFHNDTTRLADIVLPSALPAESGGSFTNVEGRRQSFGAALAPSGGSKPAWEIVSALSAKLCGAPLFGSLAEVVTDIAREVPLYKNASGLIDYAGLAGKGVVQKAAKSAAPKVAKGAYMVLQDHSLFTLGVYTDHSPALDHLHGRDYVNFGAHGTAEALARFNPADCEKLKLNEGDILNFKYASGKRDCRVKADPAVAAGTVRVPARFDNSPLTEIVLADSGKSLACVNIAELRRNS